MIDVSDINSIPFFNIKKIMDISGIGGSKYSQRISRGMQFLKVSESEAILNVLAEYGFTYSRENNHHWKQIEAKTE